MPTYRIFQNAPFDQEHIDLMSFVFDQLSIELGLSRSTDAVRDMVAKAVLECAQASAIRCKCANARMKCCKRSNGVRRHRLLRALRQDDRRHAS